MFEFYNHLGFNNPYYFKDADKFKIENTFPKVIKKYNQELIIDTVSVIELLNKNYMFGDRTLIKNIFRTPWLSKPNNNLNEWVHYELPKHKNLSIDEDEIAETLFEKLCAETYSYVKDKKKIGVLLSGGMDSRVLSGILDYIISYYKNDLEVIALTWGNDETRDVVYAKKIAEMLNWKWKHYYVTKHDLIDNINTTAIYGCEYSPIHLHAIPQIANDNMDLDIILAASYGDSIGRAEYSGVNVLNLEPMSKNITNIGGLINYNILDNYMNVIYNDIISYHKKYYEEVLYMQNELDYQLHYMRRMLNPCFEIINDKIQFKQVFTHPDVYTYMWSIDPNKRNNNIYEMMLKKMRIDLYEIPWARTGYVFNQKNGKKDKYKNSHHSYLNIMNKEIKDYIEERVMSNEIRKTRIFNMIVIEKLLRLISVIPSKNIYFHQKLIWIASFAEMLRIYNIDFSEKQDQYTRRNNLNKIYGLYFSKQTKQILKKIFKLR